MSKMMVITLADEADNLQFRMPHNSHGVTIAMKPSDLNLAPNDFIQRFISPAIEQLLNQHKFNEEKAKQEKP